MDTLQAWLDSINSFVWGPVLLVLILGTGLFLQVRLGLMPIRCLGTGFRLLWRGRKGDPGAAGEITPYSALLTALCATVGVGNIAGVATAIAAGGPGALFWMWVTGLFGMATKYSEAVLGVHYREVDARGNMAGGPMYYLSRGIGGPGGRLLGGLFALFAAFASFGIGNMVQSNSVADALQSSFGVPPIWTGIVIATLTGLVILGGIQSIGRVTGFFVPMMIAFYILGGLVVLAVHWRAIPGMFALVSKDAFSATAPIGGFLGASVRDSMRWGLARGIFSNESGLGTGGIAAAAAQTRTPVSQAMVSMTQTFIDTIIVCSITGFTILATGAWKNIDPITGVAFTGAPLTAAAFQAGLPGEWGGAVVALGLAFFAFSTLLGWAYYGERAVEYLLGVKAIAPYRLIFIAASFFGAAVLQFSASQSAGFQLVWDFSDVMNGAMAIPNLIGLLLLSGIVARETKTFFGTQSEVTGGWAAEEPDG